MNPVLIAVLVMLILAFSRVHVVLSLFVGALVGGLISGMGLNGTLTAFQDGIANGAEIALSYALLGAFAMAIAHSGLPALLSEKLIEQVNNQTAASKIKWLVLLILIVMSVMSQNIVPIHIAFIPLIVPPLLMVFNRLNLDRRLIACVITFGLVNTYLFIPYGFGDIYLNKILLKNIQEAGMDVAGISTYQAMGIPALGMILGLLIAIFVSYRKPRQYQALPIGAQSRQPRTPTILSSIIAIAAIIAAFVVQLLTGSMIIGALLGFALFMGTGIVRWREADDVFNDGIKMMAMIGFIIITAQGFAQVMKDTGQIEPLVTQSAALLGGSKGLAALVMLLIGLFVTMGIGSSFSTLPIVAVIYVPLCLQMGFSPLATVAIIGTAGVLGDAGSPASDSTLGPTAGLNADGQHNHIRDSVIPTFIHYNIPLLIFGWIAATVL